MPDILHEVAIAAAPGQVFKTITEQQGLAAWWTTHIVAEPRVGSVIEARFFDGQSVHNLEVLTLEPDRKVEWIARQSFLPDWTGTRVTWNLSPIENGTRISVWSARFCLSGQIASEGKLWLGSLSHQPERLP